MFHCYVKVHKKIQWCNWVKTWASCFLKIFGKFHNIDRKTPLFLIKIQATPKDAQHTPSVTPLRYVLFLD